MISRLARRLSRRLSYATVVSAISAFILLAGGAALAANQLAKNSVGTKQLKRNAVTTAKIKRNAVTTAKIRKDAVTGAKVKDGSLTGSKFAAGSRYSHVVHSTGSNASVPVTATPVPIPLDVPTYTQAAGENDFFHAVVDLAFAPGCEATREASVYLLVDPVDPAVPNVTDVFLTATVRDEDGALAAKRVSLGSFEINGGLFEPEVATRRTLTMLATGECSSGNGITVSNPRLLVTGVR